MGEKSATKAELTRRLNVVIRTAEREEHLVFEYLAKGVNKDVYKGGAWVLKLCDVRYDSIAKEIILQEGQMGADVLQHLATTYTVVADMQMHASLQQWVPFTAESSIAELLQALALDPIAFMNDLFELMASALEMQIRLTRCNIEVRDAGWHNLAFIGTIRDARLEPGARTPWLDLENCEPTQGKHGQSAVQSTRRCCGCLEASPPLSRLHRWARKWQGCSGLPVGPRGCK